MTGKEKNAAAKARIAVSGKVVKPYVADPLADGPRATSNKMKSFAKASNFREAAKAARTLTPALDLKPYMRAVLKNAEERLAIKLAKKAKKTAKLAKLAKAA